MESVFDKNRGAIVYTIDQNGIHHSLTLTPEVLALIEIREAIEEQTKAIRDAQYHQEVQQHREQIVSLQAASDAYLDIIRAIQEKLTSMDRSTSSHCDKLHKMADQYNEMEGWKTRVEKLEDLHAPSIGAFLEVASRMQTLEAKAQAFQQAVQSVISHQGETAKIVQDLTDWRATRAMQNEP
jgi:Mg2+ and Co2+ transporter CorA